MVRGPSVLDIGCAGQADDQRSWEIEVRSAEWVHGRLRQQFPQVFGIDITEERPALLRERGFDQLYKQSAESFELPQRFDTIVAGEVIEHVASPGLFLERARAHLLPGGRIVLTTPNTFSAIAIMYALLKYPRTCSNPEHTMWFCPQTLSVLAERCGLRVLHWVS
jgi:2-polyprenyl-3-methyl-5-hydroxy-6-metoxy-1,4-benzoquinol methylase